MEGRPRTHELNMIPKTYIGLAIGALGVAALAGPAASQAYGLRQGYSPDSTKAVTETRIPYSDIDATSSAGARALLARIEDAAELVCGGAASAVTDYQKEDFRECRRAAVSGAVARMRKPAMTRLASRRQTELRAAR